MKRFRPLSRRGFLIGAGAAATIGAPALGQGHAMRRIAPNRASDVFTPDVELELICKRDKTPILTGKPTRVWRYVGNLIKGPPNALTALPDAYLGPLLRFTKGQKVRIRLRNELPEETITHWHGLHVPMLMDGHPTAAIDPGETYVYEFEIRNRAGRGADDRQPARERLGDRHSVTFVQRGQHEQIRAVVVRAERRRIQVAGEPDAMREPLRAQQRPHARHRRRVALEAAGTRQAPVARRNRRQRAQQQLVSLSRRQRRHAEHGDLARRTAEGCGLIGGVRPQGCGLDAER